MNRQEKKEFVEVFSGLLNEYSCMLVVRQSGLKCGVFSGLRVSARKSGGVLKVVKNNLAKRVFGEDREECSDFFKGPVAVLFSQDAVSAAKILVDFSKKREDKFQIVAGLLEGKALTNKEIQELASLPPLDQMRGILLGVLASPASRLVGVLSECQRSFLRVLNGFIQKQQ